MNLKELSLHNFRNYDRVKLHFSDQINVLIGANAQGKTNLLESIYVLALTRSHRTTNNRELIRWQQDNAQLKALIARRSGDLRLELDLSKKGKIAKVNHIEQAKLSSYVGTLNVILFAPEDLQLVKGAPQQRRHFMDVEFGQMSNKYLYETSQYQRVLKQRNRYLKAFQMQQSTDQVYLDVLSDQLAAYGAQIIFQRLQLLKKLERWSAATHAQISQHQERLQFSYQTTLRKADLTSVDNIYRALKAGYQRERDREIRQGTTVLGPHRDDLKFKINHQDVQTYGSQGQQRTTALSVKLAEIDLMKEETGEYPILLLDDVLSELDDARQTHLLKTIQDKVQTFLTTTSLSGIARDLIAHPAIFNVKNGLIKSEEVLGK